MSMLGSQIKELREAARNIQGKLGRCLYRRKDVDEMQQIGGMLFEAADAIESLRDRLQELQGVGCDSRYTALFGTPERAARTLIMVHEECESVPCSPICPFGDAPACPSNFESGDYDALLEWLRGEGGADEA